jgi:UDP-glucose 4-epimerase
MNCGITGHTGVLGRYFLKQYSSKIKFIKYRGDITNRKKIINWIKKNNFEYFIHFAAIVPVKLVNKNYNFAKKVNFYGTKNIVDGLKLKNQKIYLFFSSTSHVYNYSNKAQKEHFITRPISNYGKTKIIAENYITKALRNAKVTYCIGRIFSYTHYTQNKSFFLPRLSKKKKINRKYISQLNTYRDFIDIRDICSAIFLLIQKKSSGIFNIASGKKINLIELLNFIKKFNYNLYKIKSSKNNLYADISKIKKLGWRPRFNINNIINNFTNKI